MSDHLQLPRLAQLSLWLTNIFKVPGRVATVNYLGLIDHPNFIKLIGYCTDDDHKLLVYKYMERGSLDNYLFRSEFLLAVFTLDLSHGTYELKHDFNSTSILIDSNHNARISNFGMVKDGPVDSSGQVIYTKGYTDPEYIKQVTSPKAATYTVSVWCFWNS
ncbi:putative transferase, protein kinase RLK-Pelle-RLCK-VIIa-2 family [Helianthus annuus]|nr:putative transferase, protein kinase RLK-Pelle-RLCK-VIIa-2 family [Helianthus annuus]KAJ0648901.1 putative transferase, protein kinase RLK-Pelle-RLCK-VIIa-2 family [Helianthus annuus]